MKTLLAILLLVCVLVPSKLGIPQKPPKQPVSDLNCMAWVVHDESRGEPLKASRAVLDVVLKRMRDSGKTACQVVAMPYQFSGYSEYAPVFVSKEVMKRYLKVARMKPVAKHCKYFHSVGIQPEWATKFDKCGQIGRLVFYKERKK